MAPQQHDDHPLVPQQGPLLVATPQLSGTPYDRQVVLLVAHGEHGSQGIIVNRAFRDSLKQIHEHAQRSDRLTGPIELKLGVVQWAPGQLEAELKWGVWLTTPATQSRMLGDFDNHWRQLVCEIGRSLYRDALGIRDFPTDVSRN